MSELAQDYRNLHVPENAKILDHLAPRSRIHVIPSIHIVITYAHIMSFMALTLLAVLFTNFADSPFFQLTKPVVAGHTIEKQWELVVLCIVLGIDSFFSRLAGEVIGEWKSLFIRGDDSQRSLGKAMTVVVFDLLMYWVRNAVRTVFLYSQITFAIPFAVGDMLAHYIITKTKIHDYLEVADKVKSDEWNIYRRHWQESSLWILVGLQVVGFGLLQFAFWLSGFFKSDYFSIGPPISFFAVGMDREGVYWTVVVYVFFDQFVASFTSAIIDPWVFGNVYNNGVYDKTEFPFTENEVYGIFYTNKIIGWIRSIVVLNLLMEQIVFTAAFFLAELIYTVVHTWIAYKNGGRVGGSVYLATVIKWIQGLGLIILALSLEVWKPLKITDAEGHKIEMGYFVPPPPFFLLGEMFTSRGIFALFCMYAAWDRALATTDGEVVAPYISFVINGADPHGVYYGRLMTKVIVWTNNIARWVRTVFSTNFMLSSFYFSLTMMVSDILTSALVIHMYMRYKAFARHKLAVYHEIFGYDTDPDTLLADYDDSNRMTRIKKRQYQYQRHFRRTGNKYISSN